MPPLVETGFSNKPLSIALEEIAEGKIDYERTEDPRPSSRSTGAGCCSASPAASPRTRLRTWRDLTRRCGRRRHGRHDRSRRPGSSAPIRSPRSRADPCTPRCGSAPGEVLHVRLAHETDVAVVAPATANLLAKLAHGPRRRPPQRDPAGVSPGPLVLAPAMHAGMWEHPPPAQRRDPRGARRQIRGPGDGAARPRRLGDRAARRARGHRGGRRRAALDRATVGQDLEDATSWSRPDPPTSRSTPCGSSATDPAGRWAWR